MQGLSNLAWAWATLGIQDHPMMKAIARRSLQIPKLEPQSLANLVWAFSTVLFFDSTFFGAVAESALRDLS